MANMTKYTAGGVTYNVKDAQARQDIAELKSAANNIGYMMPAPISADSIIITDANAVDTCNVSTSVTNTIYRTGKNMFWCLSSGRTNNGITFAVDAGTKKITASGTATSGAWLLQNSASIEFMLPAGDYIMGGGSSNIKLQAMWYDAGGTLRSSALSDGTTPVQFAVPINTMARIQAYVASGTVIGTAETISPMLVMGEALSAWEAPSRISVEMAANGSASVPLVAGTNHLFSTETADYTYKIPVAELARRVDGIESDLGEIDQDIYYYDLQGLSDVAVGGIHTISNDDVVDFYDSSVINYRIGTNGIQQYDEAVTLTPDSGYRMYIFIKATGESSYTGTGWKTAAYTIPAGAKWGINVARTPEDTTAPADLATFAQAIKSSIPLATLRNKVDALEEKIDAIPADTDISINQKYVDRTDALTQLTAMPMFLIFTDIHGFGGYLERIGDFHNSNCASYCKDVLCLGDIVYNEFSDDFTFMSGSDFGKNALLTIGNHDCYDGSAVGGVSATDLYNKFFANVGLWNVVQPTGAAANGYCYYYKDYDNKVRLIVLNEYYWDSAQKDWFEATLSGAKTAGLAVLVAQHQGNYTQAEYTPLENYAFGMRGYDFVRYTAGYTDRRNAVDAFIADGGEFVGWLSGHTHCEQFCTYTVNSRKQLSMTFSNAGQDRTSRIKIPGYSQDCFYYLAVDTTNKRVYVLTIGQATNKYFHRNLMLAYDYQVQEVVEYY